MRHLAILLALWIPATTQAAPMPTTIQPGTAIAAGVGSVGPPR